MRPCFHNGPSKGVNKREVFFEETKIIEDVRIQLICTFMYLKNTESSVRECVVSIVHIYVIFLSLYIFEEIFFVDIVCVFQVGCETVPYFWPLVGKIAIFASCETLSMFHTYSY